MRLSLGAVSQLHGVFRKLTYPILNPPKIERMRLGEFSKEITYCTPYVPFRSLRDFRGSLITWRIAGGESTPRCVPQVDEPGFESAKDRENAPRRTLKRNHLLQTRHFPTSHFAAFALFAVPIRPIPSGHENHQNKGVFRDPSGLAPLSK